ncbi:sel1 repeat family protein [Massilia sp. Dwa41.01b]|uniref:SEL1-like repeat protein n=1 Tax=Massilia sp. Dwa41.01b TaxID=2709302 RepID=UPI001601B787|nr:SEL1-like repeat protein [Massilia sp. Dwa41.01b]QNA89992.1 sel1 repeat family protein [Massilia sp. Dwa41.01b]
MPTDLARGHALIRAAAEKGYAEAQFSLGAILLEGEGPLAADPDASERWVRKAAAQGHPEACRIVGLMA